MKSRLLVATLAIWALGSASALAQHGDRHGGGGGGGVTGSLLAQPAPAASAQAVRVL